jgi:hypothetical protein
MSRGRDIDFYVVNDSGYDLECAWAGWHGHAANNPPLIKAHSAVSFCATEMGSGVAARVIFKPVGSFPGIIPECVINCQDPVLDQNSCVVEKASPILETRLRFAISTESPCPMDHDEWGSPKIPLYGHPLGIKLYIGDRDKHSHWMRDNFERLKGKKLGDLCLPGTHDSATSTLLDIVTEERNDLGFWTDLGRSVGPVFFPSIGKIAIGCARATGKTIAEQLVYGVRAFDFRVWPQKEDEFFSVHSFLGVSYLQIVSELKKFLAESPGELVYARFRFYDERHIVKPEAIKRFLVWLAEELGPYAVLHGDVNPFETEFASLVGKTAERSRVLIHFYNEDFRTMDFSDLPKSARDTFFTTEELCMYGDTSGGADSEQRISAQVEKLRYAKQHNLNFCLWFCAAPDSGRDVVPQVERTMAHRDYTEEVLRVLCAEPMNREVRGYLEDPRLSKERCSAVYVDWIEDMGQGWVEYLVKRSCQ